MSIALLLPLLVLGQDQSASVTYTTLAKPAYKILKELSDQTKVKLVANADAGKEVLLISVHEVPLKTLMDRIATVASCSWREEGGGYRLEPAQGVRSREAVKELSDRTAGVASSLARSLKGLEPKKQDVATKKTNEDEADVGVQGGPNFGMATTADHKAIVQILNAIGPAAIASITSEQRFVFASNNATRMQTVMPDGSTGIITEWITNHNAEVAKAPKEEDVDTGDVQLPKEFLNMFKQNRNLVNGPVSKAILVIKHVQFIDTLQATLTVFDQKGGVVLNATDMVDSDRIQDLVKNAQDAQKGVSPDKPQSSNQGKTPIEFSDDSKELMKLLAGRNSPMEMAGFKLSPTLKSHIFRPDDMDPLAYMASDTYLSVAKHEGRQLVADLPDEAFGYGSFGASETASTVEGEEKAMKRAMTVVAADDGQFLLIRPSKPEENRRVRLDRPSLAALMAAVSAKDIAGLDDICAYALKNVPPMENTISSTLSSTFMPNLMGMDFVSLGTDWNMYRFYGSLAEGQRQTLASGGSVPFNNLDGGQQDLLAAVAFGANAHPEQDTGEEKHEDFFTRAMSMSGMMMGGTGDYKSEPTEIMPSGLPADGFLTAKVSTDPVFKPEAADGKASYMVLNPMLLSLFQMMKDGPIGAAAGSEFDLPQTGKVGQETIIAMKLHVAKSVSMTQTLTDISVPKDGQLANLKNLPSSFQSRIAAEMEALKKSPFASIAAMGAMKGSSPPP